MALSSWAWLRFFTPRNIGARIFLALTFAFAAFWNVGYIFKSAIFDAGDWAFFFNAVTPRFPWHIPLVLVAIVLYSACMRILAAEIRRTLVVPGGTQSPFRFCAIAYGVAGIAACVAALYDPRGPGTILNDAVPSSFGSIGLIWAGWIVSRKTPDARVAVPASLGWIAAGIVASGVLIGVLGPGLRL